MISTLNKISNSHNSCEDSFDVISVGNYVYGAVSDGCSTGLNSHFISHLFCKIFRSHRFPLLSDLNILRIYFELKDLQNKWLLGQNELWATLTIFQYKIQQKELKIRCFGDGVFYVNGVEHIIDQQDKVNYLMDQKDIVSYLEVNPVQIFNDVDNFRICSDGIKQLSLPSLKLHK